ncbi:DUF2520 domain-containing protein [Corynebacterium choanae]|uniref:Rossmann-like domain protein n=1 Tax=Corynebacterium choanae TaxID=1862358 RepID=A0A3G6J3W1_9CORY|nr:DUF2520 domain-containing protein [Corynebacterium choanae]AZA12755.1 Rossmann-like domain protein [Corynebacterium choanae]
MSDAPTLTIGIVSDTDLGEILADALRRVGHNVIAHSRLQGAAGTVDVWSKRRTTPAAPDLGDPLEHTLRCPCVVLAVQSTHLPVLVEQLLAADTPPHIVAHTAINTGTRILTPLHNRGIITFALTPLVVLAGDIARDWTAIANCSWAVTADDLPGTAVAEALVEQLTGQVIHLPETSRPLFAAGFIHAVDHQATVIRDSLAIMSRALGTRDQAAALIRALAPQLAEAVIAASATDPVLPTPIGQTPALVDEAYRSIQGYPEAELFTDLVARRASIDHVVDVELWAHNNRQHPPDSSGSATP